MKNTSGNPSHEWFFKAINNWIATWPGHQKPQAPGVTDVSGPVQETLLGKRRDKKGYQDTRMRAGAEAPATSWYKTTLG
jgi:hypothetical protein